MNETAKKIFDEIEDYFARVSHIHKRAEQAERIVEEYADGTSMELTSVWEVLTLHKNGLADYETMSELQENIGTIANSRLLREFESYIKQLKKEYTEDVDEEETETGEWFVSEYEYLTCSECGESYYTGAESTAEAHQRLREGQFYPFCPHCGKPMDSVLREEGET